MTISTAETVPSNKAGILRCAKSHTQIRRAAESQPLCICALRDYQRDTNQHDLTQQWCPLKHLVISYQDIISFDKKLDVEWARDGKSLCDLSGSILHLDQKDNDIMLKKTYLS